MKFIHSLFVIVAFSFALPVWADNSPFVSTFPKTGVTIRVPGGYIGNKEEFLKEGTRVSVEANNMKKDNQVDGCNNKDTTCISQLLTKLSGKKAKLVVIDGTNWFVIDYSGQAEHLGRFKQGNTKLFFINGDEGLMIEFSSTGATKSYKEMMQGHQKVMKEIMSAIKVKR